MVCRVIVPFPVITISPAVQAVRNRCAPARERSWALQGLSQFYREDAARLVAQSDALLARSHRPLIRVLP
jgi:hypothetical protein